MFISEQLMTHNASLVCLSHKHVTQNTVPFPPPVLPGLWVEGNRPGHEVNPADNLTDYWQDVAMDNHEADPDRQTRRETENWKPSDVVM